MKATTPNESNNPERYLPDFFTESIGKSIRRMRHEQSYTPETLAKKLNITEETLEKIEQGKEPLTITRADEIARMLGTTTEDLVKRGDSFFVGGDIAEQSFVGSPVIGNETFSYNIGVSEVALNNLTSALNRICDMLDTRLK